MSTSGKYKAAKVAETTYYFPDFLLFFIFSFKRPTPDPQLDVLLTLAASAAGSLRSATLLGVGAFFRTEGATLSGSEFQSVQFMTH